MEDKLCLFFAPSYFLSYYYIFNTSNLKKNHIDYRKQLYNIFRFDFK